MSGPASATIAPVERLHALDSLRAFAMLLGIVLHAALSFIVTPFPWIVRDVSRAPGYDVLLGFIHGFRMPLFYFIAGFFAHLLWQRLGTRGFIAQRLQRIGLPFAAGMFTILPLSAAIWQWAERYTAPNPYRPRIEDIAGTVPTMHLWFLEMLLILYAGALLLAWAGNRLQLAPFAARLDAGFDWLIRQPWKPLLLVPTTMLCLWNGPMLGEVDQAGMRFVPALRAVAYYALFFALGWWMHRRRHLLDLLRGRLKTYFAVALAAFLVLGACHSLRLGPRHPDYLQMKFIALAAASLYTWSMTFAITGLFLRVAAVHRAWVRYLADASYWWYLWHIPIVLWLQVLVAPLPLPSLLKLAFILAATVAILLPSYHWLVRYTWVGRILNGPRLALPQPA